MGDVVVLGETGKEVRGRWGAARAAPYPEGAGAVVVKIMGSSPRRS